MWTLDADLGHASQNNTNLTVPLTTSAAAAAGSWIFVALNYKFTSGIVGSAADNGPGLSWSILDDTAASGTSRLAWLAAPAPAGMVSGKIITVTLSSIPNAVGNIAAIAFAGGPGYNKAFDAKASNTWTVAGGLSGSITVPHAWDLVLGASTLITGGTPALAMASGTEIHDFSGGANGRWMGTFYDVPNKSGAKTYTGAISGTSAPSEGVSSVIALTRASQFVDVIIS